MTTRILHEVQCDAWQCSARLIYRDVEHLRSEGWTTLSSTAHITGPLGTGRSQISALDRKYGGFTLELCPEHPTVFDGHRPRTEGTRPRGRSDDGGTTVSCECGAVSQWVRPSYRLVGLGVAGPRHTPELAWWWHLPAELQWYAIRREAVSS